MNELERTLTGDSAAAPPSQILQSLDAALAEREIPGCPRTIYAELWHVAYWQQITLEWIAGVETPYPTDPAEGFPSATDREHENWDDLRRRFFNGAEKAAAATRDWSRLENLVRCSSPPGSLVRTMTVREQLESLAAHNAYHFGRIVLMRQILRSWPPAAK